MNEGTWFKCPSCPECFSDGRNLYWHLFSEHPGILNQEVEHEIVGQTYPEIAA